MKKPVIPRLIHPPFLSAFQYHLILQIQLGKGFGKSII